MKLKLKHSYTQTEPIKNIILHHLTIAESIKIKEPDFESAVVLLQGKLKVNIGQIYTLERKSVFDQKASAIYIPNNTLVEIEPEYESEIAIVKTKANSTSEAKVILPKDITEEIRGNIGYRRKVYNILDKNSPSQKLVLGETINFEGEWSSFPPHKHDTDSFEEAKMEEIYLFKIHPKDGFGLQRIYTEDNSIDEAIVIEDNDIVLIPKGYHPVVVIPGYKLYYLWVLVGDTKKLKPNTQEKFRWLIK
jgi:5-deoxy-glucuronate isomerase